MDIAEPGGFQPRFSQEMDISDEIAEAALFIQVVSTFPYS